MSHTCQACGHEWESLDQKTARTVVQAAKINQQRPFCELCRHLEMARRYAIARGFKSLQEAVEEFDLRRMVRASGEVDCPICGKRYRDHPNNPFHLTDDGTGRLVPWLRESCDGKLLKL